MNLPNLNLKDLGGLAMIERDLEKTIRKSLKRFIGQPMDKKTQKRMVKVCHEKVIAMMDHFEPLIQHDVSIDQSDLKNGYFTATIKKKLKDVKKPGRPRNEHESS